MIDSTIILVVSWIEDTDLLVDEVEDVTLEREDDMVGVVVVKEEISEDWLSVLERVEEVGSDEIELCDKVELEAKVAFNIFEEEYELEEPANEVVDPAEEEEEEEEEEKAVEELVR